MRKVLFLSYDGFGQSYLESLFIPILGQVGNAGFEVSIVQFNPKKHPQRKSDLSAAHRLGIKLDFLNYHNSPRAIGTFWDVIVGAVVIVLRVWIDQVHVLHFRSHVPALMVFLTSFLCRNVKTIFDTDGFVPDERADFGIWSRQGLSFRLLKYIERRMLVKSDIVLCRTENGKRKLIEWYGDSYNAKIYVIPNGKDSSDFKPSTREQILEARRKLGIEEDEVVLIYTGSLGSHYKVTKMLELFACLRRMTRTRFVLMTNSDPSPWANEFADLNSFDGELCLLKVPPRDVPGMLGVADIGLSFREPSTSMLGVSPIKMCEYLLCGIPVITNRGVGDSDLLVESNPGIGLVLENFEKGEIERASKWIVDSIPFREGQRIKCRKVGVENFSLSVVGGHYCDLYDDLLRDK